MSVTPYHRDDLVTLYHGDCIEVMRALPDSSVDAVVTDPPYGLEFMGKEWDSFAPQDRVNAARWNGRRESREGWQEDAAARSGKGGGGPSYGAKRHTFKRCTICGKRSFSGSPCVCPEPDWIVESPEGAPTQMLAFQSWCTEWATEALRVLKPGGHLLAFGGGRTWHRLACAIEDAGFEVRDSIAWMYGSGFPKSLDVSKAIDKQKANRDEVLQFTAWVRDARDAAGITNADIDAAFGFAGMAGHWTSQLSQPSVPTLEQIPHLLAVLNVDEMPEDIARLALRLNDAKGKPGDNWYKREITGEHESPAAGRQWNANYGQPANLDPKERRDAPATPEAARWQGWGTALKPAFEPIVVARKPLIGTVAANVLAHGTGALNVDGCRVGTEGGGNACPGGDECACVTSGVTYSPTKHPVRREGNFGRWPANVILDESQARALDAMSGVQRDGVAVNRNRGEMRPMIVAGTPARVLHDDVTYGGEGGASRFFYTAKADSSERPRVRREGEAGTTYQTSAAERCTKCGKQRVNVPGSFCTCEEPEFAAAPTNEGYIAHPTVKPLTLMRYLVRLVTPPGGVVLEPFAGSGTTLEACIIEGFSCIGIEREADYIPLIMQRITKPIEVTLL